MPDFFQRADGKLEAYRVTRLGGLNKPFSVIHLAVSIPEALSGDDRPVVSVEHLDLGVVLHTDKDPVQLVPR